jgi:hypothetical protein
LSNDMETTHRATCSGRTRNDVGASFMLNQPANVNSTHPSSFSRKKFVTDIITNGPAGNLLCVLISTYGLDEFNFLKEIPSLMGSSSTVPTMIMYGKKVSTSKSKASKRRAKEWIGNPCNTSSALCMVHVQPRHRRASFMGYEDKGRGILGVHHPKYILLFTRQGLHVMISTANMTPQVRAAEGTFTHFFPTLVHPLRLPTESRTKHMKNDFGEVLDDFLNKVCV